ncbi:MAG TPA: hypothetical protein VKM72_16075 [Thermoanaerobaculia bacterium]|nr:hypothetical protein [Thermoanaerobaculia bacterium]
MRKLQRPPATLPTLTGAGKGARTAAEHVEIRRARPKAPLQFPDHWTEADVRGALLAFHGRVCAYCQCELPRNDPGAVEHFRPKSIYWWLAYDFTNYFLSCRVCNSECKMDKFPLPPGSTHWTYVDRDRLHEEKFLLLDPAADDIESWIRTDYWDDTYKIVPARGLATDDEPYRRALATIRFFKLNEDPRLIGERFTLIDRALKSLDAVRKTGDELNAEEVRRMASRFQPYGASIRQMLALTDQGSTLIPSPAEELVMFLQELLRELTRADQALAEFPDSGPARRLRRQVLWALAILWAFPPAGTPELVEACLAAHDQRDEVAAYRTRLDPGSNASSSP